MKQTRHYSILAVTAATLMLCASSVNAQGPGSGHGRGMMFGPGNTPGWSLMTPEERTEHRAKMMGFTNYEDCKAYLDQHHTLMMERAKEKGVTLPAMPLRNMCDRMKDLGRLK
jgi:hypothetical protein